MREIRMLRSMAALLSGGSSKEFESEVTTGRFGTGFSGDARSCRTNDTARLVEGAARVHSIEGVREFDPTQRKPYVACAIGRVDPTEGMRTIWGYMLALAIGTVIVAAVPWISIGFL